MSTLFCPLKDSGSPPSCRRPMSLFANKRLIFQDIADITFLVIARTVCYDHMLFSKNMNKTEEQYKEFVKPFGTGEFFKNSVKETLGDITPESLKKFCSEPALSSKIAQKASEKQFGKYPTIYDYSSKKKNGPVAEENKEKPVDGPQP